MKPKFTIQNANKEDILKIVGPCATCGCFGDVDFEVRVTNEGLFHLGPDFLQHNPIF